jgi:hypothetical protein
MPVIARPLDIRPRDSVDISYADRKENEVGKRERKKEGTTTEVKEVGHPRVSILLSSPVHLAFTHVIL